MNELTTMEQVQSYLEELGFQTILRDGRIDVKTVQGTESRLAVITQGTRDISQESHAMLTFTVPMASIEDFREFGEKGHDAADDEAFMAFQYRALDLNSLPSMDPFAIVLLTPDTDAAEDEIVALRASLVNDVFAFSRKNVKMMVDMMELALAGCDSLMSEYFLMSREEREAAVTA